MRAFLGVPLYRQIHDRFSGVLLPPDAGLEAEIQTLGVTPKSVAKARQTLMRSATVAGFFHMGKDRLVRPPTIRSDDAKERDEASSVVDETAGSDFSSESGAGDPLLDAIWARLPTDKAFPAEERRQWLKMLELALDMVYGPAANQVQARNESVDDPF